MIVAHNVSKYYGAKAAVDRLSFTVQAGEVVGLLGLNGAGKTTTLRMLSGLSLPTAGTLTIAEMDVAQAPQKVRQVLGFLPETPPLYPEMTVEGYLTFVLRLKAYVGDFDAAITHALKSTDLLPVRGARIDTLSHGYRRRIGIAQAIVHRPALVLLDEPTSGLDPVQIVQMRQLIRGLRGRHTVLVSSHLLGEIHQLCDRIFVLHEGRIKAEGTEAELARHLTGPTLLHVAVRGDSAQALAVLHAVDGVKNAHVEHTTGGIAHLKVTLATDTPELLAQAVVQAGLPLCHLSHGEVELEAIFLQLTGKEASGAERVAAAAPQGGHG